ncbi:hypothetical protein SEA_OBLADI_145 [Gordonia phage ObLaDi]|uniref:Uncharacterized protein n=3 Tax=Cafassovirus TaxID=3425056 RepID=A0A9E7QD18_9CAUD|nr:hypothetical protein SEA_CAFASSO_147 [Gordonia phage Cafasso]UVK59885.1 hypothetical protein SEA_ALEEMILY_145 [Gordonia phage Aleemily]UXE03868.1 hypothetical protein SEA_OBLADI_145 [Gordonia phage ObLaDi]
MNDYIVEVTETFTTRYKVRANSLEEAGDIAIEHNVENNSGGGEIIECERDHVAHLLEDSLDPGRSLVAINSEEA